MEEKNNPSVYEKLLKSKIFFVLLIPVFLTLVFGIFQNFYYRYQIKKDLNQLNLEIANLSKNKKDLDELVNYYQNQSNLEKEARVRLNLKKEGESVVIILPTATTTFTTPANIGDLSNYQKWWYYFFGN